MPPTPQLAFDKFLLEKAKTILTRTKNAEERRVMQSVTLQRRFRGARPSDRLGFFSSWGTGTWKGDGVRTDGTPEEVLMNMKTLNIVKPTVKLNTSALVTAKVEVKCEPSTNKASLKGVAAVGKGVYQYWDGHEDHWSTILEERTAQMQQLEYGFIVRTVHNSDAECELADNDEWGEENETLPGEYACQCGNGGKFEGEVNETGQIPCQACGQMAEVVEQPRSVPIPVPKGKSKFSPGDVETSVVSSYEFRIDERYSQGGNIRKAQWFEYHYLATKDELEAEHPDFDLGAPSEISFALRWKQALEMNDLTWIKPDDNTDWYEVREIYLRPKEYKNRVEPENYQFKDGRGNVVFDVRRGDRTIDKFPHGFMFKVMGEKLLPCKREVDFREEISYGGFHADAHAFHHQPAVELDEAQGHINTLWTIDTQYRENHSKNTLKYDRVVFDDDDFERDLSPTKEGYVLEQGDKLENHFAQITPPNMNKALEGLEFAQQAFPNLGLLPQPAANGAPAPGEPYAAQLLQRQSSMGLLSPAATSKAQAKVMAFKNYLRLVKDNQPTEWFEHIKSRFGEEWKEQDIEAFLNCDIDKDLDFSFVEGSEMPTTLIERELKYRDWLTGMVQIAANLAKPELITPQMLAEAAEYAGVDYDVDDVEADTQLAESRYRTIREGWQKLGAVMSSGDAGTAIMSHPQLQVLPKENHKTHIEFWADRERALMAEEMPDQNLIACCEVMIRRHEQAQVGATQNALADEIAGQAPAIAAQQMMGDGSQPQVDPAAQAEQQQQAEMESKQADADRQSQEAEVAHGRALEMSDRQHAQAKEMKDSEHLHEINKALLEQGHKERLAKEQAKQTVGASQ